MRMITKSLVAAAAAAALSISAAGVAAAGTDVQFDGAGSDGFNFQSSGEGPAGNAHDNQVQSSRGGFTSSGKDGKEAEEAIQKRKEAEADKDLSSQLKGEDSLQVIVIIAAVAAVFAAGYNVAVTQGMIPRV